MTQQLEGTIIKIMPPQTGKGANGEWVKQEFVIETSDQYPKKICFTAFGADKTAIVNNLKTGKKVKVLFNAESREYNDKWYTTLTAWKVEQIQEGIPEQKQEPEQSNTGEADDLPF